MDAATSEDAEPRDTRRRPQLGTKICLLVALLFLVAAAWFYWTPLSAPTTNGPLLDCKSAFKPPADTFSKNACSNINEIYQFRALISLIGAVLVASAGAALFGFARHDPLDPTEAPQD